MDRRTKVGIGIAAGVVVVGGGVAYAMTRKPSTSTTHTGTGGGVAAFVFGQSSVSATASVGKAASFTVLVKNIGTAAAVPNVTGTTSLNGATEGKLTTASGAPSIGAGQALPVTVQTAGPISSIFAGKTLTVNLTLALGPEGIGLQTITGSIQVAAVPASFVFTNSSGQQISSLGTQSVKVGSYWQTTVFVRNTGGVAAVPKFSGVTSLGGTQEGSIISAYSASVAPGAVSSPVVIQSAGPIAAQFGGKTLGDSVTVTP